jgi:hypothetical protein
MINSRTQDNMDLPGDLGDRTRCFDHHLRRFVLELRRVPSAPLWNLSPFVPERTL